MLPKRCSSRERPARASQMRPAAPTMAIPEAKSWLLEISLAVLATLLGLFFYRESLSEPGAGPVAEALQPGDAAGAGRPRDPQQSRRDDGGGDGHADDLVQGGAAGRWLLGGTGGGRSEIGHAWECDIDDVTCQWSRTARAGDRSQERVASLVGDTEAARAALASG